MRRTHVSGTTATDDDGELVGEGDPHAQAMQAFRNVESALAAAETSLADVVRTRLFVADADDVQQLSDERGTRRGTGRAQSATATAGRSSRASD